MPAPQGGWTAHVDREQESLILTNPSGLIYPIFGIGSALGAVEWSPDGERLLVVQHQWPRDDEKAPAPHHLLQLWQVRLDEGGVEPPQQLFQAQFDSAEVGYLAADFAFGAWSPNGRYLPFWFGPTNSIRNDGLPFWIADLESGSSTPLAELALLNPHYQSWAPDSSALAFVAGGNRSAQVNKWLDLYDVTTAEVTTLITAIEQVPGILAWSPSGQWIAYAAIPVAETGPEWEGLMTFDNPAINGRRIYLIDPSTGESHRFNDVDAFQDAPLWGEDGRTLYYVQRHDETLALMVADLETGAAEVVAGTHRSLPEMVGYYGQGDWEEYWHDAPRASATPAVPDGRYTGLPEVDTLIAAILARDTHTVMASLNFIQLPCTTASGKGGPPKCTEDQEEGTVVEVFPILGSSGFYLTRETIESLQLNVSDLYAVYSVPQALPVEEGWPAGEYGLIFLNTERVPSSITVFISGDKIVRINYNLGRTPQTVLSEEAATILYLAE